MKDDELPPLRALVAFEAAVRYSSFKDAADQLCLTPGAVSQQVKKLEQWLGFALFVRHTRRLQVTERGMGYYGQIVPALEQIRLASRRHRRHVAGSVRLSLGTALAAKWLAPRMTGFVAEHPDINLHINATNQPVDLDTEEVDLAIRNFDGDDPRVDAQLLMADEIRVFCSPTYRDRLGLTRPEHLAAATLLHVTQYPHWEQWLERFAGIGESAQGRLPGLHFDQVLLGIEAAKRDQGLVLANRLLVEEELERGELVEPFAQRLALDKAYYLIQPRGKSLSTGAAALKCWLLGQFAHRARQAVPGRG